MSLADSPLMGCWHLTFADPVLGMNGPLELEFKPSGELIYAVDTGGRWHTLRLTFRIAGNVLVTDRPSDPKEERTAFTLQDLYTLRLDYGAGRAYFSRGSKRGDTAPETEIRS
jgi:hypothetical protein